MDKRPLVVYEGITEELRVGDAIVGVSAEIDGGSAASVYTAEQIADGGTA